MRSIQLALLADCWVNDRRVRKEIWIACISEHILVTILNLCLIVKIPVSSPNKCRKSPPRSEQLIHQDAKMVHFIIINRNEDDTIFTQKLL